MSRKWMTLTAVCTGVFMLLLDITIVNVALPDIQADLGASLSGLQWVIDVYALTLAALLLTSGTIADIVAHRLVYRPHVEAPYVGAVERRTAELHLERLMRADAVTEIEPGVYRQRGN